MPNRELSTLVTRVRRRPAPIEIPLVDIAQVDRAAPAHVSAMSVEEHEDVEFIKATMHASIRSIPTENGPILKPQ